MSESLDAIFALLSDSRRRYLLYYLADMESDVAEMPAVVNAVAQQEPARPDVPDGEVRRRIKVELHHVHLPRLEDEGVVEYDARSGAVRLLGDDHLEDVLRHTRDLEHGDGSQH